MIEKTFLDRVSTYPGRVKLTPVSGQANTYDMIRADSPTEPGTPLDKVTFESIVHSRLTGRYYTPGVARVVKSTSSLTVNPIPKSGWVLDSTNMKGTSGAYSLSVNSLYASDYTPEKALDGSDSTEYRSDASGEILFAITFPSAIKVNKFKFSMRPSNYTYAVTTELQGSNNGTSWTTLFTTTAKPDALTEYTVTNPGEYTQYRLKFTATETGIQLREFQISSYDVITYANAYTIASGLPISWTKGQRLTIETPSNVPTLAAASNTLNGVTVNAILQASKRYELVYNGSAFTAKEV